MDETVLLGGAFFVVAILYSSVGHAGASGYLAVMALTSFAPAVMRPTALVMNIVVATIATARFYRAGCFSWRTLWPFVVTSIPLSFVDVPGDGVPVTALRMPALRRTRRVLR